MRFSKARPPCRRNSRRSSAAPPRPAADANRPRADRRTNPPQQPSVSSNRDFHRRERRERGEDGLEKMHRAGSNGRAQLGFWIFSAISSFSAVKTVFFSESSNREYRESY